MEEKELLKWTLFAFDRVFNWKEKTYKKKKKEDSEYIHCFYKSQIVDYFTHYLKIYKTTIKNVSCTIECRKIHLKNFVLRNSKFYTKTKYSHEKIDFPSWETSFNSKIRIKKIKFYLNKLCSYKSR